MEEPKCTLSDADLVEKCEQWVTDLCLSGGRKWTLCVPVQFNRDPDMLFTELINRFKAAQSLPEKGDSGQDAFGTGLQLGEWQIENP